MVIRWEDLSEIEKQDLRKMIRRRAEEEFQAWYDEYAKAKPIIPPQAAETPNSTIILGKMAPSHHLKEKQETK